MPLVIMCGFPSCGKSTVTDKLKSYFEKSTTVHVISDSKYKKNELYGETNEEKEMRANLKSDVQRLLSKDSIVILDSGNYIKGYRYELYCLSKSAKTTHAVIHIDIPKERAWEWNVQKENDNYQQSIFNAVVQRFETPDPSHRWDRPLITITADQPVPFESINEAVFSAQVLRPNKSTRSIPLNATNYLYELDRKTQETVNAILEAQRLGECNVDLPESNVKLQLSRTLTPGEMARIRRQFITYSKTRPLEDGTTITGMFVQYLNCTVN